MKIKQITKATSLFMLLAFAGCSKNANENYSRTTGWAYNDKTGTGFAVKHDFATTAPSGMVAIEGGTFTEGAKGEFTTAQRDSKPRRVTVNSFYMDQYEVRNIDWREYTNWMKVVFGRTAPRLVQRTEPDYKCWREELAYNEPYLENYFTHPAFDQYPIVGVTWDQAVDYCTWRTDRVNELALIDAGVIAPPDFSKLQKMTQDSIASSFVFNTQKYLYQPTYNPTPGKRPVKDLSKAVKKVDMSDGILVPNFRLPTEAEWEFAAYAIVSGKNGFVPEGKLYPWSGYQVRNPSKKQIGQMMANFIRGRGDLMGTSGSLNDRAAITAPVNWYSPNDFGLYNMAGNVNEWVLDVYRSTSNDDVAEYNPYRGNEYTTRVISGRDSTGHDILKIDSLGRVKTIVKPKDDVRNFKDGDAMSQLDFQLSDTVGLDALKKRKSDPTDVLRPRISDKTRVYKGGSWKDRIYWLNPSTRRYLDEDKSSNDIGFRCAMNMTGNIEQYKKKK